MKKGKIIIIILLIAAAAGGAIAYMMWNKEHTKVEDAAATTVTVAELTGAYSADETKANATYLNKAIAVTGKITGVEDNQDGNLLVILEDGVQCTMRDKGVKADIGATITVKGFCTGSSLFGVLLSDCVVVQ